MTWNTKEAFFHTHTHSDVNVMQECAKSLFTLIRWHNTTHTPIHTPDQRPCPGNLFQPICAAVRVRLIVSCVRNVSETAIGKSFETLKSLLFLWQPRFLLSFFSLSRSLSNSTPPSLNLLLFSPPSFHFPHAHSLFLSPSSLALLVSLFLRITLQSECVDWRLPLSW